MTFRKLLSAIGVAASLAFASTASAKVVSVVWTCNSDGFLHVVITRDDGSTSEWITRECGPSIAVGHGFKLDFAGQRMVSPSGQTFLNSLEKGGTVAARRAPLRNAGETPKQAGGTESIQLSQADVGPQLAAMLTGIDPDWRKEGRASSKAYSIFDRWGNLLTARGPQSLVPGDMGMIVGSPDGDTGGKLNYKTRCLQRHGHWLFRKGEWGCWYDVK